MIAIGLSILVSFIVGLGLGLMGIAMFEQRLRSASEHDHGADEGDQTSPIGQRSSPSR